MRRACFLLVSVWVIATGVRGAAAQETPRVAGSGTPTSNALASSADEPARPRGLSANQGRYRFHAGRWWYRTNNGWSYFDGRRWAPYVARQEYDRRPVDPALLRLEAKEGTKGYHKWPRVAGGGASGPFPISGTQGSIGGTPSGSFTNPAGIPSAVNTSIGTSTDVGGLNARGRAFSGTGLQPNLGVGGRR